MKKRDMFLVAMGAMLLAGPANAKTISVAAPPLLESFVASFARSFEQHFPKIKVKIIKSESQDALELLASTKVNLAFISHSLHSEDLQKYQAKQLRTMPIARDAIVPAVSFEVFMNGVRSLTLRELEKIYNGNITNWEDVGGSSQTIEVIDLDSNNSSRAIFLSVVYEGFHPNTSGVNCRVPSEQEMASAISISSSAIGYLSASATSSKVRGVGIESKNNRVQYPTPENILSQEYPLTRNIYLASCGELSGPAVQFLNFLLGPEGKKLIQQANLIPLLNN